MKTDSSFLTLYYALYSQKMIILLTALEMNVPESKKQYLRQQSIFVREFFRDIDPAIVSILRGTKTYDEICEWEGFSYSTDFKCEEGVLRAISMTSVHHGPWRLSFIPPTVTHITMTQCNLANELRIRNLPRCALRVEFSHNRLYGDLSLSDLPLHITHFQVPYNAFSGRFALVRLPQTLKHLDLRFNPIRMKVLYYDAVPDGLKLLIFDGIFIRKLIPIDESSPHSREIVNRMLMGSEAANGNFW